MQTVTQKVSVRENIVNDEPKLHADFPVGTVAHQGDLIIVSIGKLPKSAKPRTDRKMATGATLGSRHILERGTPYDADPAEVAKLIKKATGVSVGGSYIGPVFVSPDDPTENDLAHPQHGNQGYEAGSVCAVVYQRNLDSELREARAKD